MDASNLKRRASEAAGFIAAHWIYFLLGLAILFFLFVEAQKFFDRRETEIQNAKINQYEADKAAQEAKTQVLLDAFNRQHAITESAVDAITAMNKTVNQLVINDRLRDGEIQNLSEAYRNARNPTIQTKTDTVYLNARRNVPIDRRESDALRADAELYPNAAAAAGANANK